MLFRTIASAFFLDPSSRDDLYVLVDRAGMTGVAALDERARRLLGFREPERRVLAGTWDAFQETWAITDDVDGLRCLQLYSPAGRYLDTARASRTDDDETGEPQLGYVRTFRDACLGLRPRAAFLDTRPHDEDEAWENRQGSRAFVLAQAPLVAAGDADALAARFFSLLYLDDELAARWTPSPSWYERDMVVMPSGRLIFAGSGPSRMA